MNKESVRLTAFFTVPSIVGLVILFGFVPDSVPKDDFWMNMLMDIGLFLTFWPAFVFLAALVFGLSDLSGRR